ncbi:hypothetical protein L226DRAFT_473630 [Lentinus tigrinus ALCF2SS1-7]|uniref:SH3 domain-containing protein n=1 Tax=Lentinus tigrinus ALCF2SS1-6 TaxID=1328759 RepID=A0A5C2RQ26_9APHY|nr:hypothetical protein L227DRAFT_513611 [Lentinus tigrinus ALCF2SS1-6]RPD68343.1 hypothetical protein L226DRAFT_473630 [Lentinus tigrinus ALCF2SS1-7]
MPVVTALQDCIAEHLMFMKDDEIVVLMQIPGHVDLYLGYCEGVVGNFHGDAVRFHGRLKKPVLTKRQSTASPHRLRRVRSPSPHVTRLPRPSATCHLPSFYRRARSHRLSSRAKFLRHRWPLPRWSPASPRPAASPLSLRPCPRYLHTRSVR